MNIDDLKPLLFEQNFRVNAYDVDVMGIVHNVVYIRWFEDLRTGLLENIMSIEELLKDNLSPILARTEVDYLKPITIFDKPLGRIWVAEMKKARWHAKFEITVNGVVFCRGEQFGYFFDLNRKRVARAPKVFLQEFENSVAQLG